MLRPAVFEPSGSLFFDKVFQDFFGDRPNQIESFRTDVIDKGDNYLLEAELPGFQKEEIRIDLDKEMIIISAKHKEEKTENSGAYVRQERNYQSYSRSFRVPGIKKEDISAFYRNGILEVTLPKENAAIEETKQIEIN